jgi:hypothetical protein
MCVCRGAKAWVDGNAASNHPPLLSGSGLLTLCSRFIVPSRALLPTVQLTDRRAAGRREEAMAALAWRANAIVV